MCSFFAAEPGGNLGLGTVSKTVLNCPSPVTKFCYECKRIVWTKIRYYPTLKTRIIAFGLSPCLLCWVPFFCHWKAEMDHHCSFCDNYLGTFNPVFEVQEKEATKEPSADEKEGEEKKQPQKKYREVGRRCGEGPETFTKRDELIKVYSDVQQ